MPRATIPGGPPASRGYWDRATRRWERFEPHLMYSLAAVDPTLFRAVRLSPGQRVLDLACGSGDPSLAIAQLVAPRGSVLGLDVSPRMLAIARRRARQRGIRNVRFRAGDMGRVRLPGGRFHAAVSRFGLMFVEDVPACLAAIRAALGPAGRAAFAVWGPGARNPLWKMQAEACHEFMDEPPPPPENGPHPMRLGRAGLLARMMRRVGFRDVASVGVRAPFVYGSADEYLAMNLDFPNPMRDLYLSLAGRDRRRMRAMLARGIRRFQEGPVVRVPGFSWVVSGRS